MANFVSNDNATSLINAINSKKDTKPVEITYAEWIVLTDEERAGTHYLITDVPEQSGGGHVIENTSGTDMPQEDNLQFVGVYTEDDSTNNRTKVNIVRDMTKSQFNALSSAEKEGFIHITDEPDNPYNGESSSGGHVIQDASGNDMTQRANMQFVDSHVSDDSTNDRTIVSVMQDTMTKFAFEQASDLPDGLYPLETPEEAVMSADMISYGEGTVGDALDDVATTTSGSFVFQSDGSVSYLKYGHVCMVIIQKNGIPTNELIGTLPEGFRPSNNLRFRNYAGNGYAQIMGNGQVYLGDYESWCNTVCTYLVA